MNPRESAMMYQSYWESICDAEKLRGTEYAGKLALEFFRLGIYGERTQDFDPLGEAIINVYAPLMLNSKKNQDKAVQRRQSKIDKNSDSVPGTDKIAPNSTQK